MALLEPDQPGLFRALSRTRFVPIKYKYQRKYSIYGAVLRKFEYLGSVRKHLIATWFPFILMLGHAIVWAVFLMTGVQIIVGMKIQVVKIGGVKSMGVRGEGPLGTHTRLHPQDNTPLKDTYYEPGSLFRLEQYFDATHFWANLDQESGDKAHLLDENTVKIDISALDLNQHLMSIELDAKKGVSTPLNPLEEIILYDTLEEDNILSSSSARMKEDVSSTGEMKTEETTPEFTHQQLLVHESIFNKMSSFEKKLIAYLVAAAEQYEKQDILFKVTANTFDYSPISSFSFFWNGNGKHIAVGSLLVVIILPVAKACTWIYFFWIPVGEVGRGRVISLMDWTGKCMLANVFLICFLCCAVCLRRVIVVPWFLARGLIPKGFELRAEAGVYMSAGFGSMVFVVSCISSLIVGQIALITHRNVYHVGGEETGGEETGGEETGGDVGE